MTVSNGEMLSHLKMISSGLTEDGNCADELLFASQIELYAFDEDAYLAAISSRVSAYCHDSICKLMDEAGFPCPDLRHTLRKTSSRRMKSLTEGMLLEKLIYNFLYVFV